MQLLVGARDSLLSRAQVEEVRRELAPLEVSFEVHWMKTRGDLDRTTSLRTEEWTDFFTKELDERLLTGEIRVAIHSAKDLHHPLKKGLWVAALTKGVDVRDALVLREAESFSTLKSGALIGTSSTRREEAVRQLRGDLTFLDIRGTIEERLALLTSLKVDGVVMAEAALIRLKLTSLNRLFLPGPSAPLQGKLAVVVRQEDLEAQALFSSIHDETFPKGRNLRIGS